MVSELATRTATTNAWNISLIRRIVDRLYETRPRQGKQQHFQNASNLKLFKICSYIKQEQGQRLLEALY